MPGKDYDGVGDGHIADDDYEVGADADYNTYHMSYIDEMVMIMMMIMVMTMLMTMLMTMVTIMMMILVAMMTKTFITRSSPMQGEVAQHCVFI